MWKTHNGKSIPYLLRRGISLSIPNVKLSEIWNKFIRFQTKCFLEQPSNRVKKIKHGIIGIHSPPSKMLGHPLIPKLQVPP